MDIILNLPLITIKQNIFKDNKDIFSSKLFTIC